MYQISAQQNYLLVIFQNDVDSLQIISAIKEVISREDYPTSNDIWIFDTSTMNIAYQELRVFAKTLSYIYPSNATRSKTALIVGSLFHSAVASEFLEAAKDLPYEIRIFENRIEAEEWILLPVS